MRPHVDPPSTDIHQERPHIKREKVGKPSIPIELKPDGVFSIGLKIGRHSADMLVLDFAETVREQLHTNHDYPMPDAVFGF